MKIKMKTLQAGPNGVRQPGKIYDVSSAEADALISGGFAEKVKAAELKAERQDSIDETEKPSEPVEPVKPSKPGKAARASAPRAATKPRGRQAVKPEAEEPVAPPEEDEDGEE